MEMEVLERLHFNAEKINLLINLIVDSNFDKDAYELELIINLMRDVNSENIDTLHKAVFE